MFLHQIISYLYAQVLFRVNRKCMNRIKETLGQKGIKRTWLAAKLDKSFSIVNAYVCNRRQPNLDLLFKIAKILQVDTKELIDSKAIK